jgi:hypothetical protein
VALGALSCFTPTAFMTSTVVSGGHRVKAGSCRSTLHLVSASQPQLPLQGERRHGNPGLNRTDTPGA